MIDKPISLEMSARGCAVSDSEPRSASTNQHADLMEFQRDNLLDALKLAIPGATHNQLLAVVRAIDSFTSAKALEVASL